MECPVCFSGLADGARVPKVLPCGHTFCSLCVDQLATVASGVRGSRALACPQCRVECQEGEISTNFALRDVLQSAPMASGRATSRLQEPLLASRQGASAPPMLQGISQTRSQASAPPMLQGVAAQALAPPPQIMMDGLQPWDVGPQSIYRAPDTQVPHFAHPDGGQAGAEEAAWKQQRKATLLEWGKRREKFMHRKPQFLMDQMVSGSGLYPIRMLEDSWLLSHELRMVAALEVLLAGTGNAYHLARDMLTPLVYDIDVRIVLDNSGSMQLDMFGQAITGTGMRYGWGASAGGAPSAWMDQCAMENKQLMRDLYANMRNKRGNLAIAPPNSPLDPLHRRWFFARDALTRWMQVYNILGIDPWVYLLNAGPAGTKMRGSQLPSVFQNMPQGRTPMTESVQRALQEHVNEDAGRSLLLLVVTDGEADNMQTFSAELDRVQNDVYGDVQVCFMGLSLVPRDIEWFENEECDETRIRTVEAYEVEQRQIQLREVVSKEGAYNFEMHTYRVLLTNFFPADYDYEAPLQNLRHRLYITLHGRDRWYGLNNPCWRILVSNMLCAACFIGTGKHCCGWCQGNECGKYQTPEILEGCCGDEE